MDLSSARTQKSALRNAARRRSLDGKRPRSAALEHRARRSVQISLLYEGADQHEASLEAIDKGLVSKRGLSLPEILQTLVGGRRRVQNNLRQR